MLYSLIRSYFQHHWTNRPCLEALHPLECASVRVSGYVYLKRSSQFHHLFNFYLHAKFQNNPTFVQVLLIKKFFTFKYEFPKNNLINSIFFYFKQNVMIKFLTKTWKASTVIKIFLKKLGSVIPLKGDRKINK